VLEIDVPDDEIVKRLSGRRVHPGSGRVYHVNFNPPRTPNKDNETGEDLVQREDDREDTVRNRLAVYYKQTKPLVSFYAAMAKTNSSLRIVKIDGVAAVDNIKKAISESLG